MEPREVTGPEKLDTSEQQRTRDVANRAHANKRQVTSFNYLDLGLKPTSSTLKENLYEGGGVDDRGTEDRDR